MRRFWRGFLAAGLIGLGAASAWPEVQAGTAAAMVPSPVVVADFSGERDVAPGDPMLSWFKRQAPRWKSELGTPAFFSIKGGALRLTAKAGPLAKSWNPTNLTRLENKVILRVTPDGFRVPIDQDSKLEVAMAPVRLPGKGADLTDSDRNDACFYLLVSFEGRQHSFHGAKVSDTIAYVWADGKWKSGGQVGRDPDYEQVMRYIALGRGPERLGEIRTFSRDLEADFKAAYPERAKGALPAVTQIGLMIDSNTLETEAESALRAVRIVP